MRFKPILFTIEISEITMKSSRLRNKYLRHVLQPDSLGRRTNNMESNVNIVKKSKEEKKVLRKQLKVSHTLLKHEGISIAPQPTKVNRKYGSNLT